YCAIRVGDEYCLTLMNGNLGWANLNLECHYVLLMVRFSRSLVSFPASVAKRERLYSVLHCNAEKSNCGGGQISASRRVGTRPGHPLAEILSLPEIKFERIDDAILRGAAWK